MYSLIKRRMACPHPRSKGIFLCSAKPLCVFRPARLWWKGEEGWTLQGICLTGEGEECGIPRPPERQATFPLVETRLRHNLRTHAGKVSRTRRCCQKAETPLWSCGFFDSLPRNHRLFLPCLLGCTCAPPWTERPYSQRGDWDGHSVPCAVCLVEIK